MKLKAAFEEMELVLNELNEQFETIKKNETRVPQIEIDIIKATMRKLYEGMSNLNQQKQFSLIKNPADIVPEKIKTGSEVEMETKELISVEAESKAQETIQEETALFDEDLAYEKVTNDFLHEIDNLEEIAQNEAAELKKGFVAPERENIKTENPKPSLLLQFEDEIFSVNESVAQKGEDKSIVNKLSNTRIENLKSAIGINDKFYFINELFSGNSQAYEDVIYTLNNFKRFEDAMQYVSTLKYRYDWKTETEAYQKLAHFLERKFGKIHA